MDFEWDAAKSARCQRERGFSFADVVPAFADPARRIEPDDRFDYGEPRFRLFGRVAGRLFVIVYTVRAGRWRIISARKANEKERKHHDHG
jgi:uncharacterized DUF497 family protein